MLVLVVSVRNRSTAPAECFGRGGTLDAGVPVRPVVAAGMRDIAAPLHGAGEGLEADAAGAGSAVHLYMYICFGDQAELRFLDFLDYQYRGQGADGTRTATTEKAIHDCLHFLCFFIAFSQKILDI